MGEDLKRDQTIKLPFFRSLKKNYNHKDLIFHTDLRFSEANVAPDYPGPDVKRCCTIRSDLRNIDKNKLLRRVGADGRIYYDINYHLVLCTAQANLRFSLEIDGKEMGSVQANYT